MVVARYERRQAVGTESRVDVIGFEVQVPGADGHFSLERCPRGSVPIVSEVVTRLTVSRPGFFVFHGPLDGANQVGAESSMSGGVVHLEPTSSFLDEREALDDLREVGAPVDLPTDERALYDAHLERRQGWFEATWPDELAEEATWEAREALVPVTGLWGAAGEVRAVALLPDGGWAVVRDSSDPTVWELVLGGPGGTTSQRPLEASARGLTSRGAQLAYISLSGELVSLDASGRETRRLPLLPAPENVRAAALRDDGGVLVATASTQSTLMAYDASGSLEHARDLPEVHRVDSLHLGPEGQVWVQGDLSTSGRGEVAGMQTSPTRTGAVRLDGLTGPAVSLYGVRSIASTDDGLWVWTTALRPTDRPDHLHAVLQEVSWAGEVEWTHDLSDRRPTGRCLLAEGSRLWFVPHEADRARGPQVLAVPQELVQR